VTGGYERRNREFWDADADDYQAVHAADLDPAHAKAWGVWRIPEADLGLLGDVAGLDVLEYGCGAAQWALALAGDGARVVGLDQSRAQLRHARRLQAERGVAFPLVTASAATTPFRDARFDLVFCDHGAMSFCDPAVTVPEVGRLLRPGGRFVFCKTTATPQYYSSIFESSSWNHATAFQAYVAKKYNRGSQAAICYPRATKDQAEKYMDQLIASARANVPEDAPKREVVVRTNWSPPPPEPPKPATAPMAAASTAAAPAAPAQTPAPQ